MQWHVTPYVIVLFLAGCSTFLLSLELFRRKNDPGAFYLALAMVAEAEWALCVGMGAAVVELEYKILFSKISYLGIYSCIPLFLLFTIHYSGFWQKILK